MESVIGVEKAQEEERGGEKQSSRRLHLVETGKVFLKGINASSQDFHGFSGDFPGSPVSECGGRCSTVVVQRDAGRK